jgi:hypothetical protein
MKRTWIAVYVASLVVGLALCRSAPARWGLEFPQAMLLGSALYFGALHRYTLRATAGEGTTAGATAGEGATAGTAAGAKLLPGLLLRAAFFLAVAGFQALACFEWMPTADVRGGFVLSGTWLVSLSLIDPPPDVKAPKEV